ncbi:hypothetical protein LJK88_46645 [Paenibacillus sp. P26]|nr:hypothetical protein LJK88_46645 [Paenibacillus sp. P26]
MVPDYLIDTWAGKAWIVPGNAPLGEQVPVEANLEFFQETPIYLDPGLTRPTWIRLAPQTVKVKAKWDRRYLIETPNGDRWIEPWYDAIYGLKEVRRGFC